MTHKYTKGHSFFSIYMTSAEQIARGLNVRPKLYKNPFSALRIIQLSNMDFRWIKKSYRGFAIDSHFQTEIVLLLLWVESLNLLRIRSNMYYSTVHVQHRIIYNTGQLTSLLEKVKEWQWPLNRPSSSHFRWASMEFPGISQGKPREFLNN